MIAMDRRRLSYWSINKLCGILKENSQDNSFASFSIMRKVQEIEQAVGFREKKKLTCALIDFINDGYRRQDVGGIVDYRDCRKGSKSLSGDRLDVCPVCGEVGQTWDVFGEQKTIHKALPFFMGSQTILACNWKTGEQEESDPILKQDRRETAVSLC